MFAQTASDRRMNVPDYLADDYLDGDGDEGSRMDSTSLMFMDTDDVPSS